MALFFGKKKEKDPLQTLSESEIQKKLYGQFRANHQRETSGEGVVSSAPRQKTAVADRPSSGVAEWVRREQEVIASMDRGAVRPAQKSPLFTFRKMGEDCVNFLRYFLGGILAFLLMFNFRKASWQRLAYGLGALAFLGILFFGIHVLNVQRELGMKGQLKKAPPMAAASSPSIPAAAREPEAGKIATEPMPPGPKAVVETAPPSQPESEAAVKASASKEMVAPKAGSYVIQVATYATASDADRLTARLKRLGLNAFTNRLSRAGGRVYYCVFLGRYPNYREADRALDEFKRSTAAKPFQDAFVRPL